MTSRGTWRHGGHDAATEEQDRQQDALVAQQGGGPEIGEGIVGGGGGDDVAEIAGQQKTEDMDDPQFEAVVLQQVKYEEIEDDDAGRQGGELLFADRLERQTAEGGQLLEILDDDRAVHLGNALCPVDKGDRDLGGAQVRTGGQDLQGDLEPGDRCRTASRYALRIEKKPARGSWIAVNRRGGRVARREAAFLVQGHSGVEPPGM